MTVATCLGWEALLRDTRHLGARAAGDLADWLAYLAVDGKADRTLYSYQRELALLLREYPDHEVGDFTAADITNTLAIKPQRSRYITRSIFNQFFEWLEMDERIDKTPMRRVPRMRQPSRRPKDIFSMSEVALLEGLDLPDGPLWTLLFKTGLRRGEARRLKREHINLNRSHLVVYQGKGGRDRIINFGHDVATAVADLDLGTQIKGHEHLWYIRRADRILRRDPIADTTFERWYRRCIERAGVRYLNPHQSRHTFGWWVRELGFDIEERQIMMGHSSIKTTEFYYGRVTIEDIGAKYERLGI